MLSRRPGGLELLLDDLGSTRSEAIEARRASAGARLTLMFMKAALDGSDMLDLLERALPLVEELLATPHGSERLALLVS